MTGQKRFTSEFTRKSLAFDARTLADKRQVVVNISAGDVDRAGDIVVQEGIDFKSFMAIGGTILWNHNADQPIARALELGLVNGKLRAVAQFPEPGVSAQADETYGLIKAGVVNAASIGFKSIESEPINPRDPFAGQRFKKIELMEFSFVSVPAAPGATIVARSFKQGRVLSADNEAHIDAVIGYADKLDYCRVKAADIVDELGEVHAEFGRHAESLRKHLRAIQRAAGAQAEPDVELEARIGRLKEIAALEARGREISREIERGDRRCRDLEIAHRAMFPSVPKSFRRVDAARQVRAIITTGGPYDGLQIGPAAGNVSEYLSQRAVLWQHDTPVAWCADLNVFADRIEATAQFPAPGVSARADEIFDKIAAGDITGVSMGFSYYPAGSDWYLREWSFCYEPADKGARILSVGGHPVIRPWDDPEAPRMPSLEEAGPTPAHWAAAFALFERLRRNAAYR